jgi:hypothetical protein
MEHKEKLEKNGTQGPGDSRRVSLHSREGMSWGHGPGLQRGGYVMGTIGTGTYRESLIPRNTYVPRV